MVKFDKGGHSLRNNALYMNEVKIDCNNIIGQVLREDDVSDKMINYLAITTTKELTAKISDDDPILIYLYLIGGVYFYK